MCVPWPAACDRVLLGRCLWAQIRLRWEVKTIYWPGQSKTGEAGRLNTPPRCFGSHAHFRAGPCTIVSTTGERIIADHVIVSVPPPVLADEVATPLTTRWIFTRPAQTDTQTLAFEPPLPRAKISALRRIKFEPCFKLALRFSARGRAGASCCIEPACVCDVLRVRAAPFLARRHARVHLQ